ncbi:MAG TPA: PilW family protein [Pseudoxanthomonas sp.]|nr:PilW family protein [Pseudoxanthomonas sp.]
MNKIDKAVTRQGMRGVTLIELMIALLIGIVLLLGLVQIFSASRAAYQLSQGIARNQESSRFAIDFLSRDLRMAGHTGCINDQSLLSSDATGINGGNIRSLFLTEAQREANTVSALPFPLRFDVSIQGFEAAGTAPKGVVDIPGAPVVGTAADWSPALPPALADLNPVAGSDILVLRYFSAEEAPVTAFDATGTITYADAAALATAGSGLFAVADCRGASVFQASATPTSTTLSVAQTGLNASSLGYVSSQDGPLAYKAGSASLFRVESIAYYIGIGAAGEPALYRARWTTAPGSAELNPVKEEMVEGIESMQLLFGRDVANPGYIATMDTAGAISNATSDAANAAAWRRVGAVQVGLLVRNAGERAAALQSADGRRVLEVTMNVPADANYRSTYETTVALRNRLIGN